MLSILVQPSVVTEYGMTFHQNITLYGSKIYPYTPLGRSLKKQGVRKRFKRQNAKALSGI